VKPGARVLGVAASDAGSRSYLAGVLVRRDRTVDGFAFADCTVGGTDATAAAIDLFGRLDREDCRLVLCAGVAPAWFNLLDLPRLHEAVSRPVVAVSFEESAGLEPALREQFDGDALADRLAVYGSLPPRHPVEVNDERVFVRAVGCDVDRAAAAVRETTPAGGRPEPLRVARLAARAHREAVTAGPQRADRGR